MNRVIHIELTQIKTIYLSSTTNFYLKDCEIIGNDMNSYEGLSLFIIGLRPILMVGLRRYQKSWLIS